MLRHHSRFSHILRYHLRMTDDNGRDLSAYPRPGVAEIGILKFDGEPTPRPALNPEKMPLAKAGPPAAEYAPTPQERIAAALERIALTLERTDI